MPFQINGQGGQTLQVDSTHRAARVSVRPLDHGTLGHYRLAQTIALPATLTTNSTFFSLRWGDATRFMVIQKLRLEWLQTLAATATPDSRWQMFIARSFTASDTAGTAIAVTGNNAKKRTNMGTSLVTDVRFGTAATGLTAGTRTLDANPTMELQTNTVAALATAGPMATFRKELEFDIADGIYPYVFAQNEGFIIRGPTTAIGTGTANLLIDLAWAEVASFDNAQL